MNFAFIFKETQRNTVHGGITPSFIEKASGTIQMLKIIFVGLTPPEPQVANLEITPEMTRRIPLCLLIMIHPSLLIRQPFHRIIRMHIFRMPRQKLQCLGPQRRNALRGVIQIDREPVCLVVVRHPAEDVVVDVAEEMYVGLDAPVVLRLGEGGVFVEEATVPAAHLVVGGHVAILDVLLGEEFGGFLE